MWRFMFAFSVVPPVLQLILFSVGFIPESPISLLEKGDEEAARQVYLLFNSEKLIPEIIREGKKVLNTKDEEGIKKTPLSIFWDFSSPLCSR